MKVKVLADVTNAFLPGGSATAGQVVEVPDAQQDGSPLVWPEEYYQPVADTKSSSKKEG